MEGGHKERLDCYCFPVMFYCRGRGPQGKQTVIWSCVRLKDE